MRVIHLLGREPGDPSRAQARRRREACHAEPAVLARWRGELSRRSRLIDEFLEFIAALVRPNTVRAYGHDRKIFFTVAAKEPLGLTSRDVLGFITEQRRGRASVENVVRISDGPPMRVLWRTSVSGGLPTSAGCHEYRPSALLKMTLNRFAAESVEHCGQP